MARRKVSTTVYLDPEQATELRARSIRTGGPYAAIIRRAIDRELAPVPAADLAAVLARMPRTWLAALTPLEKVVLAMRLGLTLPPPSVSE